VRDRDLVIGCVITLMLCGLFAIYSNTAVSCGTNPIQNEFVSRQAAWAGLSICMLFAFAHVDYHGLAKHSRLIMLACLAGLALLLAFGATRNGAKRWFIVGPFSLQISEFVKIAMVLYVAAFVSRKREVLGHFWRGLLPPLLVMGATFGLIMLQPDFGTAVLITAVAMTLLVCSGVRWKHVAPLLLTALPVLFLLIRMKEYRWRRLIVFLNPWQDPQGAGYHVCQSLIALGCGGVTGVGPGRGLQKLGFLPEAETDFIFATFGQEVGFIGGVALLAVFTTLFLAGWRISRRAPDALGSLLALGVTLLIGVQMLINVGVASSAMPTKGIALPFVSFGGSSLLALSIGVGILLNVERHCVQDQPLRVRGALRAEHPGNTA
jgi:cell division protein FtsW